MENWPAHFRLTLSDGSREGLVLLPSPVGPWRFGEWQAKAEGDFFNLGKMRINKVTFVFLLFSFFIMGTSLFDAMDQKSCGFRWF